MGNTESDINDDEFIYDDKEAARVIIQGVTENLRKKLRLEDVIKILDYHLFFVGALKCHIP